MKMLEEEEPDEKIYDAMDTYFPEGEPKQHPLAVSALGAHPCTVPLSHTFPPQKQLHFAADHCIWLFPQTPRDIEIVTEAQEAFRAQVLGLLSNRQARERYLEVSGQGAGGRAVPGEGRTLTVHLQGQLEAEYGEAFLRMLEQLFYEYLLRLESALPLPNVSQVRGWG